MEARAAGARRRRARRRSLRPAPLQQTRHPTTAETTKRLRLVWSAATRPNQAVRSTSVCIPQLASEKPTMTSRKGTSNHVIFSMRESSPSMRHRQATTRSILRCTSNGAKHAMKTAATPTTARIATTNRHAADSAGPASQATSVTVAAPNARSARRQPPTAPSSASVSLSCSSDLPCSST